MGTQAMVTTLNSKPRAEHQRRYRLHMSNSIAVVGAGVLLSVFIGSLIMMNYLAQQRLQDYTLANLRYDLEHRALAVSYFLSERSSDLNNLATSNPVTAYFANKALGMSREYGLEASIHGISELFDRIIRDRKMGDNAIYSGFALIGEHEGVLAYRHGSRDPAAGENALLSWLARTPRESETTVTVGVEGDYVTFCTPCSYKDRFVGVLVAWIPAQLIVSSFVEPSLRDNMQRTFLVLEGAQWKMASVALKPEDLGLLPELDVVEPGKVVVYSASIPDHISIEMVALKALVAASPFSLVTILPWDNLVRSMSPGRGLALALSFAVLLLGGSALLWRRSVQVHALNARLDESIRSREDIALKNLELEREIKEKQEVQAALRTKTVEQALLLDTIPTQVWYLQDPETYGSVNRSHAEFLGREAADLERRNLRHVLGEEEAAAAISRNLRVFNSKQRERSELTMRNASGDVRFLSLTMIPELGEQGEVDYVICAAEDLTERERAEEALLMAHNELNLRVRERTRELEELQQELINKAMEAGRAQLSAMVLHNIGNAVTPVKVYIDTMASDGLYRTLHYFQQCYHDLQMHLPDIQHYLEQDSRGKEVFSYMGRLIESLKNYEGRKAGVLEKIGQAVDYISEILTLQQGYAAIDREVKELTDINGLLRDAVRMQGGALEKRTISVELSLDADLPRFPVDKNRLMQVVVNLIKNSYEAIDEIEDPAAKRTILLKTINELDGVRFEVTDSGIGVDRDHQRDVFDLGGSHKGTSGFGLYYCRQFVVSAGGWISLNSSGKNTGTTVTVFLPYPATADPSSNIFREH
jgi:PAS domain S-box-containing protein